MNTISVEGSCPCPPITTARGRALDVYFEAFLAILLPSVNALIDLARAYEALDKPLQQIDAVAVA